MYTFPSSPILDGAQFWAASDFARRPILEGVRVWAASDFGRRSILGGVRFWTTSDFGRRPILYDVRFWTTSDFGRRPILVNIRIVDTRHKENYIKTTTLNLRYNIFFKKKYRTKRQLPYVLFFFFFWGGGGVGWELQANRSGARHLVCSLNHSHW